MKALNINTIGRLSRFLVIPLLAFGMIAVSPATGFAQDDGDDGAKKDKKRDKTERVEQVPVRRTFNSNYIIDNQSVIVPTTGTFEWNIQHRFGTFTNGYNDFWGFFASSNIRLGFAYVPVKNLQVGFGITKYKTLWDFNVKYALLEQSTSNRIPISITYYGNMTLDGRKKEFIGEIYNKSDRLTYFHQIILARKFHEYFSLQVAPSLSHFNLTDDNMKNDHFALAVGARVKLTTTLSLLLNYDQPLTKHTINNPDPNVSVALEVSTSSHAFQLIFGNYYNLNPQEDNYYNTNYWLGHDDDKWKDNWRIGFNITRLWNW